MDNDKYIGRLLDNRYEILEVIGVGGMAVVYKARCHRLNRLVAVKILKDDYCQDDEFRRRFHAEGQAVAMVSHPNIVSVYDVSTSDEADYIVMELIDGISLKQYMEKKGVLNWKETLHFAIQIGKALDHAHGRGIVHRDIKPHNVMVLKNGSVKVADFGIARVMSESNTLTREALGSVHYISPEQAKGGRVDNRSDLYSLGVVMYEMMTGRPPYNGESPVAVAIAHINGGAPMPSTLNPNIPGGLEQIIMKAMAHEPGERYDCAAQMLADMDEFRKNPGILFDYHTPPTDAVLAVGSAAAGANAARGTGPIQTGMRNTGSVQTGMRSTGSIQTGMRGTGPIQTGMRTTGPVPRTAADRAVQERSDARRRAAGAAGASQQTGQRRRTPGAAVAAAAASGSGQRRRRPVEEEDNSRAATVAVIACSAVAILALIIFLVVVITGGLADGNREMVEVPSFLGENYGATVKNYAYNPNIHIKLDPNREYSYSDRYAKEEIVSQRPAAGTQVPKGTVVHVTVSLGEEPEVVYMENHTNKTVDEARGYLDALKLDLQVKVVEEVDDTVEAGKIIRTEPIPGQELLKGDTVTLYVSTGPEIIKIKMENLLEKSREDAVNWLDKQKLNLIVKVETVEDKTVEEGLVCRTRPAAGEDLKTGDTVILYIAKGMKTELMPSLTGMTQANAEKALTTLVKDLGLKLEILEEYKEGSALGSVTRTIPAYNEKVRTGDTVTIYICSEKKTKMPDLVGDDLPTAIRLLEYAGFDKNNISYEYKASDEPKDKVLGQSIAKDTEVAISSKIVLTLSEGAPQPVAKSVTFLLVTDPSMPYTEAFTARIVNAANGAVVMDTTSFQPDKTSLTLTLEGTGTVTYNVFINGVYAFELDKTVTFN